MENRDMLILTLEQQRNEALAQQINRDARTNPRSLYRGKYVGLVGGQVVAVTDTSEELFMRLQQIEPDPSRCLALMADADYDTTHFIGGGR
jgi:hypothetical protein